MTERDDAINAEFTIQDLSIAAEVARAIHCELDEADVYKFGDPTGARRELMDGLITLDKTVIDTVALTARIYERSGDTVKEVYAAGMQKHRTMLQAGKVCVPSDAPNKEYEWVSVDPGRRTLFQDGFDELEQAFGQAEEESPSDLLNEHALAGTIAILQHDFIPAVDELCSAIPSDFAERGPKTMALMTPVSKTLSLVKTTEFTTLYKINPNHPQVLKIARKMRKLTAQINELCKDPVEYTVGLVVKTFRDGIGAHITNQVHDEVAQKNKEILETTQATKTVYARPVRETAPNPEPEQTTAPQPVPQVAESVVGPHIVDAGSHELVLPWMNNSEPTNLQVSEVKGGEVPLYIVRAISRRIERFSERARAKSPTQAHEKNIYDHVIEQEALRIASGISPRTSKAVKRFFGIKDAPDEYGGLGMVWSNIDRGNNPPRVYFALSQMARLASETALQALNPNQELMVVIAETDKTQQDVLFTRLTGETRRVVRKNGAGPI